MTKNKLKKSEEKAFQILGKKIRSIILNDLGYKSLDSFALEHHDVIAKPTLYAICDGERDFQFSTLLRLADCLGVSVQELIAGV